MKGGKEREREGERERKGGKERETVEITTARARKSLTIQPAIVVTLKSS